MEKDVITHKLGPFSSSERHSFQKYRVINYMSTLQQDFRSLKQIICKYLMKGCIMIRTLELQVPESEMRPLYLSVVKESFR